MISKKFNAFEINRKEKTTYHTHFFPIMQNLFINRISQQNDCTSKRTQKE